MKLKKDILIRNFYARNELFYIFLRKLQIKFPTKKALVNVKILQKQITRHLSITRHRNRCNFSGKPRSVLRDFKASGFSFKNKAAHLDLNGFKKAS